MKKRILVADDYADSVAAMEVICTLAGNDVRTAKDGTEAVAVAEEFRPELILLDIGMPGVDGFDVSEYIRQQPWGANITIVAVTGWPAEKFRERALDAGFDYFLSKPIDTQAFEQLMNEIREKESKSDQ